MFLIFIFVFEKCQNSFSMGPLFGLFWSAKYLNFGGESCEIKILSHPIQETYTLRKVKSQVSLFHSSWQPNLSDFMVDIRFCVIRFLWILYMFEPYDTIFWFKLTHPEIIIITLSSKSTCCIGTVVCRYRNFFNRPITLSTCMRTLESCLEVSTSHWDNCDFPFVKQGILRTAPADALSSWRLKPLSARKRSPKVNFFRNPDCKVIYLSDARPNHPDERKLTRPVGVTPTKYLIV